MGKHLLALQAEIDEQLKKWEVEAQKAERERKEREADAPKAPSKKKPPQKSVPTPFLNPYNTAEIAKADMFKGRELK